MQIIKYKIENPYRAVNALNSHKNNSQEENIMAGKVLANNGQVGENVKFDRIRRITGYLVGTTDRFNNAKRAEERHRVKHSMS